MTIKVIGMISRLSKRTRQPAWALCNCRPRQSFPCQGSNQATANQAEALPNRPPDTMQTLSCLKAQAGLVDCASSVVAAHTDRFSWRRSAARTLCRTGCSDQASLPPPSMETALSRCESGCRFRCGCSASTNREQAPMVGGASPFRINPGAVWSVPSVFFGALSTLW